MLRAIIVDDLIQARENLKEDISSYCDNIEIIGEAEGVVSGAKIIKDLKPDLVFLDIQMQDGSGFDLLEIINDSSFKVIFTTASDEYAVKAFKFSAVDYLLKPVDPDELMAAVDKVEPGSGNHRESIDLLKDKMSGAKTFNKLALHTLDKILITDISDIIRCESSVNYTTFFFADKKKLLVTKTLKEYDKMLSDHGFFRVHQSHLINVEFVKEYIKSDGGYLVMKDGSTVPVSTRKKQIVMGMIAHM
jgi:two-component system LytT family response regulator